MDDEVKKQTLNRQKFKSLNKRKVQFDENTGTMISILKANNEVLYGEHSQLLSIEEYERLKKQNLMTVQNKFFEVMEKNSHIFKIPYILHQRKKHIQDTNFIKSSGGQTDEVKITFHKNLSSRELLHKTQTVKIHFKI